MDAQRKANETAAKVDNLNEQLGQLQRNFLKNDYDAKEIKSQSDQVREAANNAHESATQVWHLSPILWMQLSLIESSLSCSFAMIIVKRMFR